MPLSAAEQARFLPAGLEHFLDPEHRMVRRHVAVLFVDIVGCARLCEELPLVTMNALIESHLGRCIDIVQQHDGLVNEIMGDGFMAIFGAGTPSENAEQAVTASRQILSFTARAREESEYETRVHLGLHTGEALVGLVCFGTQRGERWTFTASGPVTNTSARLCDLAAPDTLMASTSVVSLLSEHTDFVDSGRRPLKNIREPVHVHALALERAP